MENPSSERGNNGRRGRGRNHRPFSGQNRDRGGGGGGGRRRRNATAEHDPVQPPDPEIAAAKFQFDFKIRLRWEGLLSLKWLLYLVCFIVFLVNHTFTEEFSQELKIPGREVIYTEDRSLGEATRNFIEKTIPYPIEGENLHRTSVKLKDERQGDDHCDASVERVVKPIHCHDFWDEVGFILDEMMHKFISNFYQTFPATKPVSTSSSSSSPSNEMRIFKLFKSLQNVMVFV